ncbi:MAG: hypothetical protein HFF17_15630, partial [Oscillospiraceae bacterium]|nr:hypothetical protein [Oscillospiraceae bacterium]
MRKKLFAAFLLLGLSLGFLCGAHFQVGAAADQVEITQTDLLGDPAALEGLVLDLATYGDHGRHLRWDTRCAFTGGLSTQSQFTYHQTPDPWERFGDSGQILYDMPSTSYSISTTGFLDLAGDERELRYSNLFVLPMIDVASRAPADSSYTEQVRIRDYYDFFPLSVNFRLLLSGRYTYEEEVRLSDTLSALFQVPVPEDLMLEITVTTDELGRPVEIQSNPVEPDPGSYWIDTFCANTGDALYFTANCRVDDYDQPPIIPEAPGGYGLYTIPLEEGRLRAENLDRLALAYPIDPQRAWILALEPTEDGSRLLLVTQEEGRAVLTVIDRATMEDIQRLELFPVCYEEDNYVVFSELYAFSGCLLLHDTEGNFLLLAGDGSGGYEVAIRSTLRPVEAWDAGLCTDPSFAYDGQRLAAAAYDGSSRYACSFYLAVYDPSGPIYAGEYAHSQDRSSPDS